ncbi:MAG: M23 family metallopeptidase [Turneriella sp.]|nr:M23 family metallopeptidase [Turneriella sp.]
MRSQRRQAHRAITIAVIPASGHGKRQWQISYRTLALVISLLCCMAIFLLFSLLRVPWLESERRISQAETAAWLARWEILERGKERISANLDELQQIGIHYYRTLFSAPPNLGDLSEADLVHRQNAKILPLLSVVRFITVREDAFISMPIGIAVRSNQITSLYGRRTDPFGLEVSFHTGVDFAGGTGNPIYATADGVVVSASDEGNSGLGKNVRIEHKHGLITVYGHMSEIVVRKDQKVRRGDLLGYVGSTGRSTGPHLHYEIRVRSRDPESYYDLTYNPMPFIREKL